MADLSTASPEILYHYCSTEAFVSIVQNRSIWLSSLTLSNDAAEGKIVKQMIMQMAKEDGLPDHDCLQLEGRLSNWDLVCDGLGFCLSEEGNLVSQWSEYANDGRGVAIGFSTAYLKKVSGKVRYNGLALKKVTYDPEVQRSTIEPDYDEIRRCIINGAFKTLCTKPLLGEKTDAEIANENQRIEAAQCVLDDAILLLFSHLYILKNPDLQREKEWRLLSHLSHEDDICLYRSAQDRIIPYQSFELTPSDMPEIVKVILGSNHATPINVVKAMLKKEGFGRVAIERSRASYKVRS